MAVYGNPLIQEIKLFISDEIDKIGRSMADGGVGTWDQYNKQVGRVKGLKDAIKLIDDVVEKYMTDDDE